MEVTEMRVAGAAQSAALTAIGKDERTEGHAVLRATGGNRDLQA
jgi:hypothetical protein